MNLRCLNCGTEFISKGKKRPLCGPCEIAGQTDHVLYNERRLFKIAILYCSFFGWREFFVG